MSLRDSSQDEFDELSGTSSLDSCPECPGALETGGHETTCDTCGLIVDEYWIDHGRERYNEPLSDAERTGPPLTPTRHDRGLSTVIGRKLDGNGNRLPGTKRRHLGRLRVQHRRARWRTKAERNLAGGLGEVRRVVSSLDLPRAIRDRACRLFRSVQAEDLLRGRSIEAFVAASVYAACRCTGVAVRMSDVAEKVSVQHDRVVNAFGVMNRELGLPVGAPSPTGYVPTLAAAVGVSSDIRLASARLAERAEEAGVHNGRNPAGVAAACIYEASRDSDTPLSQGDLGECADVSPNTVRARWYEVRELLV